MNIAVTILGGFLGAGKTTAVNHLLRHAGCRVAVLVNDFGAVNIDARLIEAREGDLIALSNGCVCCSIGPDLSETLARVLDRVPAPERIVIEASGVSDPWRIAQLVRLEKGLALEVVAVLVDAEAFPGQLADPWLTDTLERQLLRADIVLLNKCDVADAPARHASQDAIRRIRPDIPVIETARGAVPGFITGTAAMDSPGRIFADAPDHEFRAWHWDAAAALNETRLRALLAGLPASVLRVKGFCRLGPNGDIHLLQRAGRRWTLERWDDETVEPGIVLIGTGDLPAPSALEALFTAAGETDETQS